MNKKIGLIVGSTIFLVITLFTAPIAFAQQVHWDYCKVSAYGTGVLEEDIAGIIRVTFNVAAPPSGSNITNTYEVMELGTGLNYTDQLTIGEEVRIRFDNPISPIKYTIDYDTNPIYCTIYYEGEVTTLRINGIHIPEFPTILAVPLFMTATLLALIYRRKRSSQTKTTE
jgi:hypothetical protein